MVINSTKPVQHVVRAFGKTSRQRLRILGNFGGVFNGCFG